MREGTKPSRKRALLLGLMLATSGLTTGCLPGSTMASGFPNTSAIGQAGGDNQPNFVPVTQDTKVKGSVDSTEDPSKVVEKVDTENVETPLAKDDEPKGEDTFIFNGKPRPKSSFGH